MRMLFSLLALMAALMPAARADEMHTFVIATDLHYISPALTDHGAYFTRMLENADGKVTAYIDELTDAFLREVIADGRTASFSPAICPSTARAGAMRTSPPSCAACATPAFPCTSFPATTICTAICPRPLRATPSRA